MQYERRRSYAAGHLSNDLLLQIQEQQMIDSRTLHDLKGDTKSRIEKLEAAATRNWWMTYVITPALILAHAIARSLGAKL